MGTFVFEIAPVAKLRLRVQAEAFHSDQVRLSRQSIVVCGDRLFVSFKTEENIAATEPGSGKVWFPFQCSIIGR